MDGDKLLNFRPMCAAALLLAVGVAVSRYVRGTPYLIVACFICVAAFGVLMFVQRYRWAALTAILLISLLRGAAAYPAPIIEGEYSICGVVCEAPVYRDSRCEVVLEDVSLNGSALDGRLLAFVYFDGLEYGDAFEARGNVYLARDTEDFDAYHHQLSNGIVALADTYNVRIVGSRDADLYGVLLNMRGALIDASRELFGVDSGIVEGMLLGDKTGIRDSVLQSFRDSGVAHLFAVSGLHVSIFAAALTLALRRANPWARLGVVAVFLFVYCALTAFPASLVRASLMTLFVLLADPLKRRYDVLSSLCAALIVILLVNPFELYTAGLQLSFLCVYAIAMLTPPLHRAMGRVHDAVALPISVAVSGTVGSAPLSAHYFSRLPLVGVFTNVLIMPLVPLIVVPALLAIALYFIWTPLAHALAWAALFVLRLVKDYVTAVASVSFGTITVASPPLSVALLMYLPMLLASDYCLLEKKKKLLCAVLAAAIALVLLATVN
ncbi:MAG: ComEC/Rec2 family competence protein [Clostridia bacterium]|nr:ComEC/Rec2 family competence protein [Clostridia bacterium]